MKQLDSFVRGHQYWSVSEARSDTIFNNPISILTKDTEWDYSVIYLLKKPAAGISISEAKMHQDWIIHIRNKKHNLKDKTSILENTHIDFTVSLPLKKWDKKTELMLLVSAN